MTSAFSFLQDRCPHSFRSPGSPEQTPAFCTAALPCPCLFALTVTKPAGAAAFSASSSSIRSDGSMRTYEGTLVTLDAFIRLPFRQMYSYTTLFVCSQFQMGMYRLRYHQMRLPADRHLPDLIHRDQDLLDEFRQLYVFSLLDLLHRSSFAGTIDLADRGDALIYCSTVHVYDVLSLLARMIFSIPSFRYSNCLVNRNIHLSV